MSSRTARVQPVTSIPPNEVVYSISGREDEVWAGRQRGGLTRLRFSSGGAIASQSYTEANGLAQNSAYAVYESRDGSVWAGTLNGGCQQIQRWALHHLRDDQRPLLRIPSHPSFETRDGEMWFATPAGLSSFSTADGKPYHGRGFAFPRGELPFRGFIRNSLEWNVWWSCLFSL